MYELVLIAKKDFPSDDEGKVKTMISNLTGGATIDSIVVMGKKRFAYPITGQTEGMYILAQLSGKPLTNGMIQKAVKMQTDVIRFLLTKKGE